MMLSDLVYLIIIAGGIMAMGGVGVATLISAARRGDTKPSRPWLAIDFERAALDTAYREYGAMMSPWTLDGDIAWLEHNVLMALTKPQEHFPQIGGLSPSTVAQEIRAGQTVAVPSDFDVTYTDNDVVVFHVDQLPQPITPDPGNVQRW